MKAPYFLGPKHPCQGDVEKLLAVQGKPGKTVLHTCSSAIQSSVFWSAQLQDLIAHLPGMATWGSKMKQRVALVAELALSAGDCRSLKVWVEDLHKMKEELRTGAVNELEAALKIKLLALLAEQTNHKKVCLDCAEQLHQCVSEATTLWPENELLIQHHNALGEQLRKGAWGEHTQRFLGQVSTLNELFKTVEQNHKAVLEALEGWLPMLQHHLSEAALKENMGAEDKQLLSNVIVEILVLWGMEVLIEKAHGLDPSDLELLKICAELASAMSDDDILVQGAHLLGHAQDMVTTASSIWEQGKPESEILKEEGCLGKLSAVRRAWMRVQPDL